MDVGVTSFLLSILSVLTLLCSSLADCVPTVRRAEKAKNRRCWQELTAKKTQRGGAKNGGGCLAMTNYGVPYAEFTTSDISADGDATSDS